MAEALPEKHEVDKPRIERAVREILIAIGEDLDREGVIETPRRVADAYVEIFSGLHEDPTRHLEVAFADEGQDAILMRDIPLVSFCEHHLLPLLGKVHVGYVPAGRVVGFSELVRLVEGYARRPQLQERLTAQIADALYKNLGSRGSIVVVEAEHSCITARGVRTPGVAAVTSAMRGVYEEDEGLRAEVMTLISQGAAR